MFKLNKKGMSLLEVLVVVLLIAGLAAMAYPAYLSSVEKAKAGEAIRLVGHAVASEKQFYEDNETYTQKFSDLAFEVAGKQVAISGATATTDNFIYTLGEDNVTASHKSGSAYTYKIIGKYDEDKITCQIGTNANDDKKICSTLGRESGNDYIIE